MGQFKPMVKMMTTEPSVELKLKKGGHVSMKHGKGEHGHKMMDGGVPPVMPIGVRGGLAPAARPARPSMAARRRAMMARPMMAEGGESAATHKAEMSKMKGLEKELKSHESKPASKAHKGLKTGGVVMGQGGFKKGGKVKMAEGGVPKSGILPVAESERGAEGYKNTKMHTAEYTGKTSGKTGEVKKGNAGGYKKGGAACYAGGGGVKGMGVIDNVSTSKPGATNTTTGGVRLGNAGGYKKGGASKKFAEGGSVKIARGGLNDAGKPEQMPQGKKAPPTPVSINQLSGTYKTGGKVTPAQGRLRAAFKAENATAMKEAKADTNLKYSRFQKKAGGGGVTTDREQRMLNKAYEESLGPSKEEMDMARTIRDIPGSIFRGAKRMMGMDNKPPAGSVTETQKSVTVTPAKKRGGSVNC